MARYSLFVVKVPLNPKQTNKNFGNLNLESVTWHILYVVNLLKMHVCLEDGTSNPGFTLILVIT